DEYSEQDDLPVHIIRENAGLDPASQIALRRDIAQNYAKEMLEWTGFPKYKQLAYVCRLIWKHLVASNRRGGVYSGDQLALKTERLRGRSVKQRILDELKPGTHAAKTVGEAVVRVLQFERSWATFKLPRLLMATSRIQRHVARALNREGGDYSFFAAQVATLFRAPVVSMLDEYGIPPGVGEKLSPYLSSESDLDAALQEL